MLHELCQPPLDEVCTVLETFFKDNFETVTCKVVDCPDLTAEPYKLTTKGLCGNPTLCDIGGFANLLPVPNKEKRYDLVEAFTASKTSSGNIMGAAGGPFHLTCVNSEMVADLCCQDGKVVKNGSYYGSYDPQKKAPVSTKGDNSKFNLLGQLLLSEGLPGKVIELKAANRKKPGKFDAFLRDALTSKYKDQKHAVGLGGVIIQEAGKSKFHVIPEFVDTPLDTQPKVLEWLKFFEMDPPAIAVGTALSHDPENLGLRLEHFHSFNQSRTMAGHCHFDVNGSDAVYKAYLILGERLLRIDQPK